MSGNEDTRRVHSIANKIVFTPSSTGVDLIDELAILSKDYPNDYNFGLMVRAIIHQVHTKHF